MRSLVLCHEGAPLLIDTFIGPLRSRILEYPDDDADLWQIWSVPPADSHAPSEDITEAKALEWASEIIAARGFGDGIEPADVLSPFPAFVRAMVADQLLARWQAEIVAALPITPNPLRRSAAA